MLESYRQGIKISPSSWQQIEADIKEQYEATRWIMDKFKKLAGKK